VVLALKLARLSQAANRSLLLAPIAWSFSHHPRARTFGSLEAAVGSIMAMKEGERL
jgi:hypothetical protein